MTTKTIMLLGTAMISVASLTSVAQAQVQDDENRFDSDEIIVTATKRETNLNDTAVAVSAFTKDRRDKLGIEGIQDIADLTPGVSIQDAPNRISIRGVGRLTNALGSDPGVGIYADGIYTSETAAIGATTLYNERIEVLRGPQGTLYGRNTVGGAVNTISIRPSEEWEGHARLRFGNYSQVFLGGSVSGPLTDTLRVRLVASHDQRDGYIENIGDGEDQWANDDFNIEAQAEWDVTDDLQVWLKYTHYEYDTTPHQPVTITPYRPMVLRGDLVINPAFGFAETNPSVNDPYTVALDETGSLELNNNHSITGHVTWDFENVTFKYMGGWQQYDYTTSFDADGTNRTGDIILTDPAAFNVPFAVPAGQINDISESKEFQSHDFQLMSNTTEGPEWIVGAYYYEEDVFQPFALRQPGNASLADPRIFTPDATPFFGFSWTPSAPNPDDNYYYQDGTLESKAYAVYGQASFDLTDKVKLTGGLRYSKDEKTGSENQRVIFDQLAYSFDPALFFAGAPFPYALYGVDVTGGTASDTHEGSWDAVTGMASIEYRPNADTLWYLTGSHGYKSGGFRLGAISDDPTTPNVNEAEVGEEKILAVELGNKTSFGDTFQLNSAAYLYNYGDLQAEVPIRRNGINLIELFNADESRSFGIETEATWQAGPRTNFIASYAFNDSEYSDFCGDRIETNPDGSQGCLVDPLAAAGANLVDPSGNTLNKAPKHKLAAVANHTIPIKSGEISLSATFAHVGSQYYSVFNNSESKVGSYNRVDGRISYFDDEGRFQLHAYVRNAFDEEAVTGSSSSGAPYFSINRSFNAPRTFGAELQVNF
jgi:iron complex outermembrane receptor protein